MELADVILCRKHEMIGHLIERKRQRSYTLLIDLHYRARSLIGFIADCLGEFDYGAHQFLDPFQADKSRSPLSIRARVSKPSVPPSSCTAFRV